MGSFLENLSPSLRERLSELGKRRSFSVGEQIFAEGEEASFLPIICEGSVKLLRYPEPGKEVIIGRFGAGEAFAIPPALDGRRFPASAVAMSESVLLLLEHRDVRSLMVNSVEFSSAITNQMCDLLRERTESLELHTTPSSEMRICRVLLKLADESVSLPPVRIKLRRQDLADIAGITTETAIRSVRRLAGKGLLRIEHGKIFIDDTGPLREHLGNPGIA